MTYLPSYSGSTRRPSGPIPPLCSRARERALCTPSGVRVTFLILITIITLLCGIGSSFAQQGVRPPQAPATPRDDVEVGARALLRTELALGPLLVRPQIGGAAGWRSVAERYRIGDPTEIETDFTIDVSPEIQAALPMRTNHILRFGARLDYNWFARRKALRKLDVIVPASYEYSSERTLLTVANLFVDGSQDFLDPVTFEDEVVLPEYELDYRHSFRSNSSSAAFEFDLTRTIMLGVSASQRIVRYDELEDVLSVENAIRRNRDDHALGASIGFRLIPSTTLFLTYAWADSIPEFAESIREREQDRFGVSLASSPSRRFVTNVSVGYKRLLYTHSEADDVEGVTGNALVSTVLGDRVVVDLTGERDLYPSYWRDNLYFDRYGGGAAITLAVTRAVRLGAGGGYHIHEYPNETIETLPTGAQSVVSRVDELWEYLGFFQWTLGSTHSIGARAGWTERASNFDEYNREGLILGAGYSIVY